MRYLFIIFFMPLFCLSQTRYVSPAGAGTHDGTSEANAWTFAEAISNASAGMTIYMKAGEYGAAEYTISTSGTAGNPISFIGYKTAIGDVVASNGSTFSYGNTLDATAMPLFTGDCPNGTYGEQCPNTYVALEITGNYIVFKNIQLTNYGVGVRLSGDYGELDNIIVTQMGWFDTQSGASGAPYIGNGIKQNGSYGTVKNCFVLNAGAEGITINRSTENLHQNNTVYCDDDRNATDYYYILTGSVYTVDNTNHILENITVNRVGTLNHGGHGLCLKYGNSGTKVYNSTIYNTNLELSRHRSEFNEFYNVDAIDTGTGFNTGIAVRDGSHNNYLQNCDVIGGSIRFLKTNTGVVEDDNAGHNNTFVACSVTGSAYGVSYFYYDGTPTAAAYENTFSNCRFENLDALFEVDRENRDNYFLNCTFKNISNYRGSRNASSSSISLDFQHQCSASVGLGFIMPTETNLGLTTCGQGGASAGKNGLMSLLISN